jgi:hypothetical protein
MYGINNKENGTWVLCYTLIKFQITFKILWQFHKCVLIQEVVYVQMLYQICSSCCYIPRKYHAVGTSTVTTYILFRESNVLRITSNFEQQNEEFLKPGCRHLRKKYID